MKVSIVIPAHNAEDTIERCLSAVVAAVGERDNYEVIVVDDASTDRTAELAASFPVRLIRLERNEGRLRAREEGARAAGAERLLFVDTRVMIPAATLDLLDEIDYEPVMLRTAPADPESHGALSRVLELIRKRVYAPYYPPPPGFSRILLNAKNFGDVPTGAGGLYVEKARFLASLPADRSRFVNDDTRLFRTMIAEKEILIPEEICIDYLPRQRLWDACRHLFHRGPRFADYHLRQGGRYYPLWLLLSFSLLVVVAASVALALTGGLGGSLSGGGAERSAGQGIGATIGLSFQEVAALGIAGSAFLALLSLGVYLAETAADFFRVVFLFPLIAFSFGLGVLRGKLRQATRVPAKTWNRRLLVAIICGSLALAYVLWGRGAIALAEVRWQQLVPLGAIHLSILAVNGLVLRRFLKVFGICLRPTEWFGLAVVTSMGSYLATGAGGLMARAAVLKHRFDLDYSKFVALLSTSYMLNVLAASLLGLGAFVALYRRTGLEAWPVPVLLALAGLVVLTLASTLSRPQRKSGPVARLISQLHEGREILSRSPVALLHVFGLLALNLLLQAAALKVAFSVFSFDLEADSALLLASISSFAIFFAITPANLGIQEGFTSVASAIIGAGFVEGLAAMAALRAVAVVNVFVLGPIFGYQLLKKG